MIGLPTMATGTKMADPFPMVKEMASVSGLDHHPRPR